MSIAQTLFVAALGLLVLALIAFTGVVVVSARRVDGGAYLTWGLARRVVMSRADRGELNRWAFYAHRISGMAIFAFLALHIVDVSLYSFSRSLYDNVHYLYGTIPVRVLECGLWFAILFHTLNGLRLLVIDVADMGRDTAARVLLGITAFTIAAGIAGSLMILVPGLS